MLVKQLKCKEKFFLLKLAQFFQSVVQFYYHFSEGTTIESPKSRAGDFFVVAVLMILATLLIANLISNRILFIC